MINRGNRIIEVKNGFELIGTKNLSFAGKDRNTIYSKKYKLSFFQKKFELFAAEYDKSGLPSHSANKILLPDGYSQ